MMASLAASAVVSDGMQLSLLTLGTEFLYRIPSFAVIHVPLRQVTIQIEDSDGRVYLHDGFVRSESHATLHTPCSMILRHHCFVPVSLT